LDPQNFSGLCPFFFLQNGGLFLFDEGCAFEECALVVEKDSWESLLSQMADSISSKGQSPAFIKAFFCLVIHEVEVSKVQDVRPCLSCTNAVQLESQHVSHLVCIQPEHLSHLATCFSVNHYLLHNIL